jgi:NADH-quinone oxidoreductase subunit H
MNWTELLVELVLMPLVAFVVGLFMVLLMRKIAARLQRRIGPPLLQPLYDILKLYGKDVQISHGMVHEMGVIMAVGGYVAAETLLPVPGMDGLADKGGLITLTYVMMVPMLGLALGVGQCANPNGSLGISRALTSMLAYDIPFVIVVFGTAYAYGTTNLAEIIRIQQEGGIAGWGAVQMPLLFVAGLFTLHASMGKEPFEIYVAPAEIATGPMVEMGGKFMGALFVMQCFQVYTATVLFTTLFLGGGENWGTFLVKIFAVAAIPFTITVLFPRYKTEDVLRLLWKWPVAAGVIGLGLVFLR